MFMPKTFSYVQGQVLAHPPGGNARPVPSPSFLHEERHFSTFLRSLYENKSPAFPKGVASELSGRTVFPLYLSKRRRSDGMARGEYPSQSTKLRCDLYKCGKETSKRRQDPLISLCEMLSRWLPGRIGSTCV